MKPEIKTELMGEWRKCDNCEEWNTKMYVWFSRLFCGRCQSEHCEDMSIIFNNMRGRDE